MEAEANSVTVEKPFEAQFGRGDVIFSSQDGIQLEAHKRFLYVCCLCCRIYAHIRQSATTSPVFSDMFDLDNTGPAVWQSGSLQNVLMAESYTILLAITSFCYPTQAEPAFYTWASGELRELYRAADKFAMSRMMETIVFLFKQG